MIIPIFCVNLESRIDRKKHINNQFEYRREFKLEIVKPIPNPSGNLSLWLTLNHIVKNKISHAADFFIFCEDDHQFTENYDFEQLFYLIRKASMSNIELISGGVSWFKTAIQISEDLFWIEAFSGLQFTVIFKSLYPVIVNADFSKLDQADFKLSGLTNSKVVIHPFISVQKEFGYSDITSNNNEVGRVDRLFNESSERLDLLKKMKSFYQHNSPKKV